MINRRQWLYGVGLVAGTGIKMGRATDVAAAESRMPLLWSFRSTSPEACSAFTSPVSNAQNFH